MDKILEIKQDDYYTVLVILGMIGFGIGQWLATCTLECMLADINSVIITLTTFIPLSVDKEIRIITIE